MEICELVMELGSAAHLTQGGHGYNVEQQNGMLRPRHQLMQLTKENIMEIRELIMELGSAIDLTQGFGQGFIEGDAGHIRAARP